MNGDEPRLKSPFILISKTVAPTFDPVMLIAADRRTEDRRRRRVAFTADNGRARRREIDRIVREWSVSIPRVEFAGLGSISLKEGDL